MIELVIVITVMSLVSTVTLSVLFTLSDTSVTVQSEAMAELKFKTLFQKIQNELSRAHPDLIRIEESGSMIRFRRFFSGGEAETLADGYFTDASQPLFQHIRPGMKIMFYPFQYTNEVYTVLSTNRGNYSLWVNGIEDSFSKKYLVLAGEGRLFLDQNRIQHQSIDWGNNRETTSTLSDSISSVKFISLSAGLLQITIAMQFDRTSYSKTEFVVLR